MSHMPAIDLPDAATAVTTTRAVNTSGGLTGGGDLSADRTLSIADNGVTMAKIEDATGASLIGASAAGSPSYLTAAQAVALLPLADVTSKGLIAPLSGSANDTYLGDGTWGPAGQTLVIDVTRAPYNATGDGATDDRAAIQSAIDACSAAGGGVVWFPDGTYIVGRNSTNFYCLSIPSGVRLHGASQRASVIKQQAGIATSVRLLFISGNDVELADLTLDGNKASQTVNEQRHGIFAQTCERLVVQRVTAQNFTGDGFYVYANCNNATFSQVYATANDRNGITMGAVCSGTRIVSSVIYNNNNQQIDSEAGASNIISDVTIAGNVIDRGSSNDYAITISGAGSSDLSRGRRWTVANNVIRGAIYVVWCFDITIVNNNIDNASPLEAVTVYRTCENITIANNTIRQRTQTTDNLHGLQVLGTAGQAPDRVVVLGNAIAVEDDGAFGVNVQGALTTTISANQVIGAGVAKAGNYGIRVRATDTTAAFRSAIVTNNYVKNFGEAGIKIAGNLTALLSYCDISHNVLDDTAGTMTVGINLDDVDADPLQALTLIGNKCLGGVATPLSMVPTAVPIMIGGTATACPIYSVYGTPEGVVTASVGAMAIRRDGSAGAVAYIKNSGTGNTGWVPVGGVAATGSITCVAKASMVDGETVTIGDGVSAPKVYEFDTNGTVTAGNVRVDISTDTTATEVAARLLTAITTNQPLLSVVNTTGVLALTHKLAGTFANVTITEAVANAGFLVTGMSGGVNPAR